MTAAARLPTSSRRRGGWGDAMTGERSRGCSGRRRPDPASEGGARSTRSAEEAAEVATCEEDDVRAQAGDAPVTGGPGSRPDPGRARRWEVVAGGWGEVNAGAGEGAETGGRQGRLRGGQQRLALRSRCRREVGTGAGDDAETVAGRGGVTVGGQWRLARAGRGVGVGVRPRGVTAVAIEAVAAWWLRRRRSCSGADVEPACAALAGSGRPRPVPSPPRRRACLCRYGRDEVGATR
ncbi:hypothetical protein OsI_11564 [Oryza sativa Indica Group]|uniref:Uncharacterized protein n=1 Tax=Oryza sativa subsp. indica TaxID=39946 RepID=A2XGN7_ORYSI|nr:hypothetical protein OsI_11564 [Oryza sativa Indica Group]